MKTEIAAGVVLLLLTGCGPSGDQHDVLGPDEAVTTGSGDVYDRGTGDVDFGTTNTLVPITNSAGITGGAASGTVPPEQEE